MSSALPTRPCRTSASATCWCRSAQSAQPRPGRAPRSGRPARRAGQRQHSALGPAALCGRRAADVRRRPAEAAGRQGLCVRTGRRGAWRDGGGRRVREDRAEGGAGDILQPLHEEVRRANPGFDRAEGMLDRLAPHPHQSGIGIQPDVLDQMLMLPAGDPAVLGCRACGIALLTPRTPPRDACAPRAGRPRPARQPSPAAASG